MDQEESFSLNKLAKGDAFGMLKVLALGAALGGGGNELFNQKEHFDEALQELKIHADDEDDGVRSDFEKADEMIYKRLENIEREIQKLNE